NSAVAMHLIGDVKGRDAVVIDDIVDTAGTLTQAVTALEREGARRLLACGVHAVLSGPAIDRIAASPIEEVVVTNSIPLSDTKRAAARITVLTVDRKSTRLNSSHVSISYAVFCLKKKKRTAYHIPCSSP